MKKIILASIMALSFSAFSQTETAPATTTNEAPSQAADTVQKTEEKSAMPAEGHKKHKSAKKSHGGKKHKKSRGKKHKATH